jgi:hypothetical protein
MMSTNKFDPSDEKERKAYEIIRLIPVVGLGYKVVRGIVYKAKGDKEEVINSFTFDIANLNPFRLVTRLSKAWHDLSEPYDTGTWIGKRSLSKCLFGVSVFPKYDAWHYAVMIQGIVYHIQGTKKEIKIEISDDLNLKKSFQWFMIGTHSPRQINEEIIEECQKFEHANRKNYQLFPDEKNSKHNCQTFVKHMLKFTYGWSDEKAGLMMGACIGTGYDGGQIQLLKYLRHMIRVDGIMGLVTMYKNQNSN